MLGWATAVVIGFAVGVFFGVMARREKALSAWVTSEVAGLREDISQARIELRTLTSLQAGGMLDRVEGDDEEIAGNLDRMNTLLDQLHGLLRGKAADKFEVRRHDGSGYEPVIFSGQLDFTTPEELLKFSSLPPISEEEIRAMDWESLLRRIATEGGE